MAWASLFEERGILEDVDANGVHRIKAVDINRYREARLMTKFDHLINLPKLFAKNGLAILPDSRSSYVIGRFECYASLDVDHDTPVEQGFPDWLSSITPDNFYSESAALLGAYHAGIVADVLEQEQPLFTVFGRMSTGTFSFAINAGTGEQVLTVDKAQCEIDGGFESPSTFAILEVKNEEVKDFHVRQLYYPYRLWQGKLEKQVVPVFMTYSNEVFTLSVYAFEDPSRYNSLSLVQRRRYQLARNDLELDDIRQLLAQTKAGPEPSVTFPQADRMDRVNDLLGLLYRAGGSLTQDDITTNYAFDVRQTLYYTSAAQYLGLLIRDEDAVRGIFYTLSDAGMAVMRNAPQARNRALIRIILQRRVFREAAEYYLEHFEAPSRHLVMDMMARANLPLNDTTRYRRTQSVRGWVRWMFELTSQ